MTVAITDEGRLSYMIEDTFNTIPAKQLQEVLPTGETLTDEIGTTESNVITATADVDDLLQIQQQTSGDTNFELRYKETDDFKALALRNDWTAAYDFSASTISFVNSTNSIDDSGTGFTPSSVQVGQWLRVKGGVTNPATIYGQVESITTGSIVFTAASVTILDEAAGNNIDVHHGGALFDGSDVRSIIFEKEYTDLTNTFFNLKGQTNGTYATTFNAGALATEAYGWIGADGDSATATIGTGANLPPVTGKSMNSADDIENLTVSVSNECFETLSFSVNNNSEARNCIGKLEPDSIAMRRRQITFTITAHFESTQLFDLYKANTSFPISIPIFDKLDNGYIYSWPNVKMTDSGGTGALTAPNADVMETFNAQAVRLGGDYIMQITRFDA